MSLQLLPRVVMCYCLRCCWLQISAAVLALALTHVLQLTGMLQWWTRQTVEVENNMTSVERMVEYINLPQEPPRCAASQYVHTFFRGCLCKHIAQESNGVCAPCPQAYPGTRVERFAQWVASIGHWAL